MASSRKKNIPGYVRSEEVEQIVRSAIRQTARAAAKVSLTDASQAYADDDRLKKLIKDGITEAFTGLGFDMSDKAKTQKNVAFMNSLAEFSRAGRAKIVMTTIGFVTIAALAAILSGLGLPAKVMAVFGLSAGSNLGE